MKMVIICEHLFRTPEIPCFKVLNDPVDESDAGETYHCMACVEEIEKDKEGLRAVTDRSKVVCASHCDSMTVLQEFNLRGGING
jgi:hypothetical protein